MRIYIEALEVPPEDAPEDYSPEFVRLDATGRDEAEVLADLRALLDPRKKYIIRRHYCGHDEGKPCRVEVIG
ncbi:MAG: hypothetical protein DRO09_02180 [Thermoprotei archaeon]|nr:MAG: hypothetical protein DRO09_02180 [Thermoprotei archaeon]